MAQSQSHSPTFPSDPNATIRPLPNAPRPAVAVLPFLAPPQGPGELGRLGPYRVLKILGRGAMGIVLRGEDPTLSRPVALKVMLPELAARSDMRKRFLREARAAAAVQHDHIVAIFHVGEDQGVVYIVMPLLKGMTLHDYLRKGRLLSIGQVLRVGKDVARGLQAAHDRGLIHRDIKPANLWVDSRAGGRIKILDFGLARPMYEKTNLTIVDTVMGSPAYMAPEQFKGKPEPRSDLYSLGAVMYLLLTGRLPFLQSDPVELMTAVDTQEPPHIRSLAPDVPGDLADLVMRLLAKRPDDRPASAQALVDELKSVNRDGTAMGETTMTGGLVVDDATEEMDSPDEEVQPLIQPVKYRPRRKRRGERWHLVVLIGGAMLLLVGLAMLSITLLPRRPRKDTEPPIKDELDEGLRQPPEGFRPMFDGKSLDGWERLGNLASWKVRDGVLVNRGGRRGMLRTTREYGDFELELDWRLPTHGESGVILRHQGVLPPRSPSEGVEVRIIDDDNFRATGENACGALSQLLAPLHHASLGPRRWNHYHIKCQGERVVVTFNGRVVIDTNSQGKIAELPPRGAIALHNAGTGVEFRNVFIRELR